MKKDLRVNGKNKKIYLIRKSIEPDENFYKILLDFSPGSYLPMQNSLKMTSKRSSL